MSPPRQFHPSEDPGYYLHLIENGKTKGTLTDDDTRLVKEFIESRKRRDGAKIKPIRRTKIAQTLISAKRFIAGPWTGATIKTLSDAVDAINESKYTQNTKNDHILILKGFYRWLIRKGHVKGITADEISDPDDGIRAPGVDTETAEAKDLITRDELATIIKGCLTARDKALVAVLYESAARISEIARLTWGDLEYTAEGVVKATIHDEKTKKKRYAPLFMCLEHLASWRSSYPGTPTDKSVIFIDRDGKPMEYRALNYQIIRAAKRSGMTKRITPHLFRKSRLTEMVRQHYQESIIKDLAWGNQKSTMMAHYIKLGSDDVMNAFLEQQGIKKREEQEKNNVPRQCSFCFAMNSAVSTFCHKCGAPLTPEARAQVNADERRLFDKFKQFMADQKTT